MTISEMKERKKELGYSAKQLADLTGIPLGTLQKIFSGATSAPRRETILKLERVLGKGHEETDGRYTKGLTYDRPERTAPADGTFEVREEASQYGELLYGVLPPKKPGEYTLEDYLALPDDQRVELIDGVFYDMAAPTTWHQAIGGFIYKFLMDHVLSHPGGPCWPFISPVDVQLDKDDKTVVQPDVLIVCDRDKYKNGRVFGAPDFLVEVLSPSTRRKDLYLKTYKYANAGVREYWIVDPANKTVIVYDLEHSDTPPIIYGFDDTVPVGIWNGECRVDFKMIYDHIRFLFEQ